VGSATYLADAKVDWDDAIGDFMVASKRWRPDLSTPGVRAYHKDSGAPTPQDWRDWVRAWCDGVKSASSDLTVDHQTRPENTWHTHPVIDGCEPAPEPDPDPNRPLRLRLKLTTGFTSHGVSRAVWEARDHFSGQSPEDRLGIPARAVPIGRSVRHNQREESVFDVQGPPASSHVGNGRQGQGAQLL
jgi:hypothetical protein